MEEMLEYIVKSIVPHPEEVHVSAQQLSENETKLLISVCPEDLGYLIGRMGSRIEAIRVLMTASGARKRIKVRCEITEKATVTEQV